MMLAITSSCGPDDPPSDPRRDGTACALTIDSARILAPLDDAAAVGGEASDAYMAACAAAIFWADGLLAARQTGGEAEIAIARRSAAAAAQRVTAAAIVLTCGRAAGTRPTAYATLTVRWRAGGEAPALEKLVAAPPPECCGYNLADLQICLDDAAWLASRCGHRVVVVGIRAGGGMIAPLWAAALAAHGLDAHWTTVRPAGAAAARAAYHPDELRAARDLLDGAPSDLLVVDDLPNSGQTVALLAAELVDHASRAWFAAIGRVETLDGGGRRATVRAVPALRSRPQPRLWELMLPEDRPSFLKRLSRLLPSDVPADARIVVRCPTLEARYGRREPWLPWNHPALAGERRRLVNPRKTPLLIADADGSPLWHLRFIGEGPWARAEQARLCDARRGGSWEERAHVADGYRVTRHRFGLAPLSEQLASADTAGRAILLDRAAARLIRWVNASVVASGCVDPPRPLATLRARLALLAERFDLPDLPGLADGLRDPARGPRRDERILYTALRYAYGNWHWQVDAAGTVHRFQPETSWGGPSSPELELASFAMEHDLDAAEIARMARHCGVSVEAVTADLVAAMLVAVEAVCRSVRLTDRTGRERLRADMVARRAWIAAVAGAA